MPVMVRYGSTGGAVLQLQQLLNQAVQHRPPLSLDGHFGPQTEAAVRLYQASVGITVDGVAGPDTWRALQRRLVRHQRRTSPVPEGFHNAPWMAVALRGVEEVKETTHHLRESGARVVTDGTAGAHGTSPTNPVPAVLHPVPKDGNAPWLAIAMREVGQKQIKGPGNNPRILEYHSATTLRARSDETAWCSSFANWCLQQVGVAGTKSAAAISWMHWGAPSTARPGAITVIYDPKAAGSRLTSSGYHVGFLVEEAPTYYNLLGGNQRNRENLQIFKSTLSACRISLAQTVIRGYE